MRKTMAAQKEVMDWYAIITSGAQLTLFATTFVFGGALAVRVVGAVIDSVPFLHNLFRWE